MLDHDPLWYKDAVIYELHVRAFHDSIGDGMGNFRGLTEKLDYLQDLGVTAIWLLPFYPSPLKDDGYDIADYTSIHAHYGTLRDFQEFLNAAHERGLRVITELVVNHTSDQHPWFQTARRAPPGSAERDFYVWSDTPDRYREARIIFQDFEHSNWAWDPVAQAYYWHRFYSHQPDLNYDNPAVWSALFPVVDFWLNMGVDGMRLDAVPYLFEREGTSCENLPETHEFLKALRRHIDEHFTDRMLLAEANQWPEDATAYFGSGDEVQMAFHFPVMPRLFMAIHMEDRFPILDIMAQTPPIPDNCQWTLFLRNHDELTLEMVTDEERDYMYRAYAFDPRARVNLGIRRRLAPLLGNNRRRIELMNGLLFSLPGTPVLYYGDEIGMGDNIYLGDRNGVRTPMQWSADRNAGFSCTNPQKLYLPVIIDPEYHYQAINVEAQQNNPNSLLWWMKRLIGLRKRHQELGRGTLEFLHPENRKILAFVRRYQDQCLLVVANLSRFVQYGELDLSAFAGRVPLEVFGRTPFPRIGRQPYFLTLAPHAFYWFALEVPERERVPVSVAAPESTVGTVTVKESWEELFRGPARRSLEALLPDYLQRCRWFRDGSRTIKSVAVPEAFRLSFGDMAAYLTLVEVAFEESVSETFVLPLTVATGEWAERLVEKAPHSVVARVRGADTGVLVDAMEERAFWSALLEFITVGQSNEAASGELAGVKFPAFASARGSSTTPLLPTVKAPYPDISVEYGGRLFLKLFRRAAAGINPDVELGLYLSARKSFPHIAPVLSVLEYRPWRSETATLAVLHSYVPNEGTAWQYTLDELSLFFERVLALPAGEEQVPALEGGLLDLAARELPPAPRDLFDTYGEAVALLGRRTAELHLALAAPTDEPAFAPEPFSTLYQRSLYQSMRNQKRKAFEQLRQSLALLPETAQGEAEQILAADEKILERLHRVMEQKITGQRARGHGDYHLGQVLYTGKDFVTVGFEGPASRSLLDRRLKRSPLRDVATMVRSLHYAAYSVLFGKTARRGQPPGQICEEDIAVLEPWTWFWYVRTNTTFLRAYLETAAGAAFLPADAEQMRVLFDVLLIKRALSDLLHELQSQPDLARIPLKGLLQILDSEA